MKKIIIGFVFFILTACTPVAADNDPTTWFSYKSWYESAEEIMIISNFPIAIAWEDNILNKDNHEFLVEVLFDNNLMDPSVVDPVTLQYLFIERYYDSCSAITQEWFIWYEDYNVW